MITSGWEWNTVYIYVINIGGTSKRTIVGLNRTIIVIKCGGWWSVRGLEPSNYIVVVWCDRWEW